jgi:hypothetical protein
MRDFIRRRRDARDHDSWFRGEVEQALREVDDPAVRRIPQDGVIGELRARITRAAKREDLD